MLFPGAPCLSGSDWGAWPVHASVLCATSSPHGARARVIMDTSKEALVGDRAYQQVPPRTSAGSHPASWLQVHAIST